jgi:putative inorganic carbon (HCO3(-)) transporter
VALVFVGGVSVLTQSRSALFGVVLSLMLLGAVRNRLLRWLAVIGLSVALLMLFVVGPDKMGEALLGTGGVSAVGSLDFAGRQEVWSRALYAIQDFPFTGVGLNQFESVVKLLYPLFLEGPDAEVAHAHDVYLQVAVDFGLGGLVAYIALLVVALLMTVRAYRALPVSLSRRLALGLACGLLAHQIFGVTDAVALGAKATFEWWLTLGLISGIYLQASCASKRRSIDWRISPLDVFGLWLLGSLIAIANVGDNAMLGVTLAILAGCALGLGAQIQFERRAIST